MSKFKDWVLLGAGLWFIGSWLADDTSTPRVELPAKPVAVVEKTAVETNKPLAPARQVSKPVLTQETTRIERYVDANRLNVREGPGKSHKVVWTLKRDQKVQVIRSYGDWSQLRGERFQGWVFSSYLTRKPGGTKPRKKKPDGLSVAKIKRILIERSHAYYPGNCPCPYNTTARGRRCGKRSAYSRPGGYEPLCYPRDVTTAMVRDYRARN